MRRLNKLCFGLWILLPALLFITSEAKAATLTFVSDTISTSALGVNANHTIKFSVTTAVPASGKIVITPQNGVFTTPSDLDFTDLDFLIGEVNKTLAVSPGSGTGSAIGVSVITGTSSSITFILNNAETITATSAITVKIGANATFGVTGDRQIQNPAAAGSYKINIKTQNSSGTLIDQANAMVAIIATVLTGGGAPPAPPPAPLPVPTPTDDGGVAAPAAPTAYAGASGEAGVLPGTGGTVIRLNPDGSFIKLTLPPNFWNLPVIFTITTISKTTAATIASVPETFVIIGDQVYSILAKDNQGTDITRFLKPFQLTVGYTNAQVAGVDEKTLRIYFLDQARKTWGVIPVTVDTEHNTLSGFFDQPTLLAVMSVRPPRLVCPLVADFNNDCRVDLVDFSILLYNWGIPKNPITDIKKDGVVDLVDFSIMMYWWTG